MKNIFTLIAVCFSAIAVFAQYPALNITMYSLWDSTAIPAEPGYSIRYNGSWGWVDPADNREYGIVGSSEGIHFIDVTTPSAPVQRDFVAGRRNQCIWREMKTYQNYLYAVSDDAAPNSMQIIDLSYLPDSVSVVYDDNSLVERAHTMWIDGDKMYLASPKGSFGSSKMGVFSLSNPTNPTLIRRLEQDYPALDGAHDMFVRGDTVYASLGWGGLYLFKFNGTNFVQLAALTFYPSQGYNHSSALTDNGNTLIFCDEVPSGLEIKSLDVSNFSNLTVLQTFKSTAASTATPHNPFVIGNTRCVIGYYQDGVQIFDISNPSNVVRTGYFDTNPTDGSGLPNPNYTGCWGAYPYLPSKILLACDMQKGLFVLNADVALGTNDPGGETAPNVIALPNPAQDYLTVNVSLKENETVSFGLYDLSGREIYSESGLLSKGTAEKKINLQHFCEGIYLLKVRGESFNSSHKIVKTN